MKTKSFPLSASQSGIYYEWEKDKAVTQYNIAFLYEFPEAIEAGKLAAAFEKAVNAHPSVKMRLRIEGDEPVQFFDEDEPAVISLKKVAESEMKGIISAFVRPFDLFGSSLYRIELYQTEKKLYALADVSHIVFDGFSVEVFNKDLARAYAGGELAKEIFTVCDYAELERGRRGNAEYLEAEAYFEKKLSGVTMARVPTLGNKENEAGYLLRASDFIDLAQVNDFCAKRKISPNVLFAGAIGICLNRYTREEQIGFCTAHHGRVDERMLSSAGMFVKTLPVALHVSPKLKVSDYLASISSDLKTLWGKQAFPFSEMVKKFGISRDVIYSFQKVYHEYFEMEGGQVNTSHLRIGARTYESMLIYVLPMHDSYEIRCQYNDSLYEHEYIKTFAAAVKNAALQMMADDAKLCGDISILSAQQEAEVMRISSGETFEHDRTLTLVDLFREQAVNTPENTAVVFEGRKLTYRELDQMTDRIAGKLCSWGVQREKVVGVMIDRSEYMVIFSLAVMKAGAAYMPLDYSIPAERLSFMIKDARVEHLLSEGSRVKDTIPAFEGKVMTKEEIPALRSDDAITLPNPSPEDMFILLYTSGSTGTPKGCMLEHRNIVNFCRWYGKEFEVTARDRSAAYANYAFDAHMIDVYPPLTCGASVYIIPSSMRMDLLRINRYMEENGLTLSFMTTQIGRQFAEDIENHSLRLLAIGGERLTATKKPPYLFVNGYGPTECTIYSAFYKIEKDYNSSVIGRSVGNYRNYIMDRNMQLLPVGAAGELCIGGEGVGRGYLNREELNREKFVEWKGERLYRSGDLARYNSDGDIEYIGRLDNQVKLRGLRIELGEIEKAMSDFDGIFGAAVEVKEIGGVQHLCGYFTAKMNIDTETLQKFLRKILPEYMVPTVMMQMEKFPLTNNGKVNRKLLPLPKTGTETIEAPQTAMEQLLFGIVAGMLKTEAFGVTTNLFFLGLTSILAIKLSILIGKKLGITVQTKDILTLKTIRLIAEAADRSKKAGAAASVIVHEKREFYPLTGNQKGLYYDWEKNREALQYNVPAVLRFSEKIDIEKLKESVIAVVEAHPFLKTTLAVRGDDVVQLRRDDLPAEIIVSRSTENKIESILSSFVRPFNLFGDTLYRFAIVQTESYTYLLFDIHHIIFDGSSMGILLNDLKNAFEGNLPVPESYTAFDRALEEDSGTQPEKYAEAEGYFDGLIGGTSMTVFPATSQIKNAGIGKKVNGFIPADGIVEFCRQHGITESNFFLAALCLTLSRYAREETIAVTAISSGRGDNKLSDLIGMFVKTLPVVINLKSLTVLEVIKNIQEQMFASMEREIYPFTKMAEKHGVAPQINYVYQGGIEKDLHLGGERAQVKILDLNTVKFPFSAAVSPGEGGYTIVLEFDSALYQEAEIKKFADLFAAAAHILPQTSSKLAAGISLVSEEQKEKILKWSAGTTLPYDKSGTFIDLFRKRAREYSGKTAVVDEAGLITFGDLDACSDRLAKKLISIGAVPNSFAAIMLPRRKEFMISVIAVMKAGAAYVPLDSEYPGDRLQYMLENSEAKVLITERGLYEGKQKEGDFKSANVLFVDEFDFAGGATDGELPRMNPEDLAYMIYTSGSTGKPKGVMIRHKSLHALLIWVVRDFQMTPPDNVCCHASFSFDASVIDLFSPLFIGATVHIISSELRQNMTELNRYLKEHHVTSAVFSTQFGTELMSQFDLPLRVVMMGGEKMMPIQKRKTQIINGYGPTEFTVASHTHPVDQDADTDPIPIGRPVPNSWSYVVDAGRQLVPEGIAGELCLSGVQIAKGYWKRDDLTAEKFIDNPFAECEENGKMYRTGDLVRWNDSGELIFLGRIDTQIKLRGFRIELGEIESVMSKFEGIASAVADVKEFGGAQQLCGYYTENAPVDPAKLFDHLRSSLTEYMVPAVLMKLPSIPLTPNGKVNRKGLPLPEIARKVEYAPPASEIEKTICRIFADILKIERVGIRDNFFEIGGSSMSAIKAIIQIMNNGHSIKYGDLFRLKTPQAVAEFLSAPKAGAETGAAEPVEDISDYDYSLINRVLEEGKSDLSENNAAYPLGNMLVTGATGYLGIHVLRELITKETGIIYCMVRAKGTLTPEMRLKSQLMYYFSDTFNGLFGNRIIPVNADISDTGTLESLKGKGISTVFNCAASVKHYAAGDELEKNNFAGVANLIGYCRSEGSRLIHVSTISTGGMIEKNKVSGKIIYDESKLYIGQTIHNKYVLSKFKAERLLLQAVSEGLDGKIMRVGNLMGRRSDGEFQINFRSNAFVNTLKSYKVLKMFPLNQLVSRVEISPIDCVAEAIVLLSGTPRETAVLHPCNNYILNMANLIYAMKEYGFTIPLVSDRIFNAHFKELMQDPRKSEYLSGLLHYKAAENFVKIPYENDFTATLLYRSNFRWPLTGEDYSLKLIGMLDGMGFFDEN